MITGRRRIVAPTVPVVSLATMQEHLRLDTTGSPPAHPEDALVQQYVNAASDSLDGEDGWLGRALMPQTWRVHLDGFPEVCERNPDGALFLPNPPLISVESVRYLDTSGDVVYMDPSDYEVTTEGEPHGYIRPLYLQQWPLTAARQTAVTVVFRCGYDDTTSPPNALPEALKHYVQVLAALMYEHREVDVTNVNIQPIQNFHDAAKRCRVYGP